MLLPLAPAIAQSIAPFQTASHTMAAASSVEVCSSLGEIAPAAWDALSGDNPFLRHAFLHTLHETGCASTATGWTPQFLLLRDGGALRGAMPLYLKAHSYGEYVFDWAWADAYHRHGLQYYPKLLGAVPFTPAGGRRLLAKNADDRRALLAAALALGKETGISSLHILFPPDDEAKDMTAAGMMMREGVQFHWKNAGYADFDDFLSSLAQTKRKKIRQERRRVRDAGIVFEWIDGPAISDAQWAFFNRCYRETYRLHHSTPYLSLDFFREIGRRMPENIVLMMAYRAGKPVAASLNMHNGATLYGRYWGAVEYHPALHFEACYYQVIEYCIARGIATFEGGAQGEHKMARGLLPVRTHSAHWLAHPQFAAAVSDFLARERQHVTAHLNELDERNPYRPAPANNRELPATPPDE
jgi:predicted N-acyltransferase